MKTKKISLYFSFIFRDSRNVAIAFLFILSVGVPKVIWAQKKNNILLDNLCKVINSENANSKIKRELPPEIIPVVDPITGEQDIVYEADNELIREFRKNSKERQLEILGAMSHSIFPLKDTVYIVDTLNFFPVDVVSRIEDHNFIITRTKPLEGRNNYMFLYHVSFWIDKLALCISFPAENYLTIYRFSIAEGCLGSLKTSITDLPKR